MPLKNYRAKSKPVLGTWKDVHRGVADQHQQGRPGRTAGGFEAIPQIEKLVEVVSDKMLMGGRFYIGAGTRAAWVS